MAATNATKLQVLAIYKNSVAKELVVMRRERTAQENLLMPIFMITNQAYQVLLC